MLFVILANIKRWPYDQKSDRFGAACQDAHSAVPAADLFDLRGDAVSDHSAVG